MSKSCHMNCINVEHCSHCIRNLDFGDYFKAYDPTCRFGYDSNGYPHFLIYDYETHAWLFKKAKHFIPEEYDEVDEMFHPVICHTYSWDD